MIKHLEISRLHQKAPKKERKDICCVKGELKKFLPPAESFQTLKKSHAKQGLA